MRIALFSLSASVMAVASMLAFSALAQPMGSQAGEPPGGNASGPRHGPPKEAIDACSGKQENAACGFSAPRGTVNGTCHTVPSGKFACVPADRMGGGHMGGGQMGGGQMGGGQMGRGQGMPNSQPQ